jgi:hypothetical protein
MLWFIDKKIHCIFLAQKHVHSFFHQKWRIIFMARESMKILISATCFYNIAKIVEHKCVEDPL